MAGCSKTSPNLNKTKSIACWTGIIGDGSMLSLRNLSMVRVWQQYRMPISLFLISLAVAISFASEVFSNENNNRVFSDQDVLNEANIDVQLYWEKPNLVSHQIGTHNGISLWVFFACSDLCPFYLVRIIHYWVPTGLTCADVGGVEVEKSVPFGIGLARKTFCVPPVLQDH